MVLETAVGEPHATLGVAISRLGFHTPVRLGNKFLPRIPRMEAFIG